MAQKKNNAKMTDIDLIMAAGFDPNTGLPLKMVDYTGCKQDIEHQLTIVDRQDAINRYKWKHLPYGISQSLIERILYYRSQGMLFKVKKGFAFLPYALNGSIDVYGRYKKVNPLPFHGTQEMDDDKRHPITQQIYTPVYDVVLPEDFIQNDGTVEEQKIKTFMATQCVLLKDFTIGGAQTNQPRYGINKSLVNIMSDCIPFMHTALLNSTGIQGVKVGSQDEYANVILASQGINNAALTGQKYVPMIGTADFQDLTNGTAGKSEEFLLAMQGLDNYRLSLYGIENGGLFQKKEHMLGQEHDTNKLGQNIIYEDGLRNRQEFCLIANSVFGTNMWCVSNDDEEAEDDIEIEEDYEENMNDKQEENEDAE